MKKIIYILIILVLFTITGCTPKNKTTPPFTITCESNDSVMEGVQTTNKSIYKFDEYQYVTEYEIKTISVYDNEETYNIYKKGAEQTLKAGNSDKITYDITTDDNTRTVNFSYKVTITKDDMKDLSDKDFYKAKKVLERAKSNTNTKCTFNDIEENQIK